MKVLKSIAVIAFSTIALASCGSNNGSSTPIDSTNVKGTAPATYGANNPANDAADSNRKNDNDTGTKANNVHNTGYDSMQQKNKK